MITTNFRTLTPAYGADYRSKDEVKAAFLGKKDFLLQPEGRPCSVADFASGVTVNIRYANIRKIAIIKVP
jgi:hypothetical protein